MIINVLGMNYTLILSDRALSGRECGHCSPDGLTIVIDKDLPPDRHNKTLLRELIRAALSETGHGGAHGDGELTDHLALALYQTLRDCGALNIDCALFKH